MVIKQFHTCVFFNEQNSQFTFQQILQQVHVLVSHSCIKKKNQKQTRDNIYMSYDTQKKRKKNTDDCKDKIQYDLIAVSIRHVSSDTF